MKNDIRGLIVGWGGTKTSHIEEFWKLAVRHLKINTNTKHMNKSKL